MLTWYRDRYEATAADAAATLLTRMWTPDGALQDPLASGKSTQRQDWMVHYLQCYVLKTTTGCYKAGIVGQLVVGLEGAGSFMPLPTMPESGVFHPSYGLIYRGQPFRATHGVGWCFFQGALSDTDKVILRILYEPIGPKGV